MRVLHAPALLGLLALLLLCSCSQDEIQEYTTEKSDFAAKPAPPGNMQRSQAPSSPEEPHWTLPEGWSERPGTGIRFATLLVDAGDPPLELRVTPLSMAARDPLANVNRWASQIGLPQYAPNQLDSVLREIEVKGRVLQLVSMTGPASEEGNPAQQILAAIVPGEQSVWFFMILDNHDRVHPLEGPFEEFMRTVHLANAPEKAAMASPHGSDPHGSNAETPATSAGGATVSGAGGMSWKLPPQWQATAETSNMRLATIAVADGQENAEVTVTRFPGDVGGLLPNINRWRRQLGMEAVGSLSDQPLEPMRVAGKQASFLDLVGPGGDTSAQRMYVVMVPHEGMTWFLKMTGESSFLETQRPSFDRFISSITFDGGTPGE